MKPSKPPAKRSPDPEHRALVAGVRALAEVELLAVLLHGVGQSNARAASVLEAAGGLPALARLGPRGIARRTGLSLRDAAQVAAALELGRRALELELARERPLIGCFEAVVEWARPRLSALEHEEVWLLGLDGQNGLDAAYCIARGGLHGCALTPRDVLRPALRDAASAMVLVHNHPSGDPEPSPEDLAMTRAVALAAEVVGVPLLDHVIVARGGASSLLELGALSAA